MVLLWLSVYTQVLNNPHKLIYIAYTCDVRKKFQQRTDCASSCCRSLNTCAATYTAKAAELLNVVKLKIQSCMPF